MKMANTKTNERLDEELERLKRSSGLGTSLKLAWLPDGSNPLAGEVVDKTIKIYDSDENTALLTLQHEFFDFAISQAVEPYKEIANSFVKLLNRDAYKRKEIVVEGLIKLISAKTTVKGEENP